VFGSYKIAAASTSQLADGSNRYGNVTMIDALDHLPVSKRWN
jgi:hypothetical protein